MYLLARFGGRKFLPHSLPIKTKCVCSRYVCGTTRALSITTTRKMGRLVQQQNENLLSSLSLLAKRSDKTTASSACLLFTAAYLFLNDDGYRDDKSLKTTKNSGMIVSPSSRSSITNPLPVLSTSCQSNFTKSQDASSNAGLKKGVSNKLTQFLQEIYFHVQEEKETKVKEQSTKLIKRITSLVQEQKQKNIVSLNDIDLMNLTPEVTKSLTRKIRSGGKLERNDYIKLCEAGKHVLRDDPTLVDLRGKRSERVTVAGDLHGSLSCLSSVLEIVGDLSERPDACLVFCGDYVDRGDSSLEVLATLLLLKLTYPNNVILLRGNHEDTSIASKYGCLDEVKEMYGHDESSWKGLWNELATVFSALPICAVTDSAFIAHAGIPSATFTLDEVAGISAESRGKLHTVVEPQTDEEKMLEGIMWSDPSAVNGIKRNERGSGVEYGPDVTNNFLCKHDLKYIIRSHELAQLGISEFEVSDEGRYVITIFSTADYPGGEGMNSGAVLHLNKEGDYIISDYSYKDMTLKCHQEDHDENLTYNESLREHIANNHRKLEDTFKMFERQHHRITPTQWSELMAKDLELPEVPWIRLQPSMAPTDKAVDINAVDWRDFLQHYHPRNMGTTSDVNNRADEPILAHSAASKRSSSNVNIDPNQADELRKKREIILTAFKFLDVDDSGSIDRRKFQRGIELMNKRVSKDKQWKHYKELFTLLDIDENGEIDLDEFVELFHVF